MSSPRPNHTADRALVARTIAATAITALATALVAALVLVGWATDIEWMKRVLGGTGVMKPWTAVSFACAGCSLVCAQLARVRRERGGTHTLTHTLTRSARIAALVPLAVGGLTLLEYLTGLSFGLDALLFPEAVAETNLPWPGRMTPAAAAGFLGLGVALLFLDLRVGRFLLSQATAAIPGVTGLIGALGYLYGVESLLRITAYSSMAVHTSLLFLLLSVAVFFARPDVGLPAPLMSRFNGGLMARRVLPFAIVLPLLLGWFRLWGERAGLYDTPFGLALFASSNVALFVLVIWVSAVRINRVDHERELAAERLASSEARSRALNEHAADVILSVTPEGRLRFANAAARELLGLEDTGSGNVLDALPPGERAILRAALDRAAASPPAGQATFDLRVRRADGDRTLEGAARNRLSTPHIEAILVSARDVTERRHAVRSLAESENRLATIFRDSPFPMVVVRRSDLRFVDVNEAYLTLLGYARHELLGRTPDELGIIAGREETHADSPINGVSMALRRKDGSRIDVIASVCTITLHGEEHVFSINFDVTDARRAAAERKALEAKYEEHSRQSQRIQAFGTLAGGIAHDFNNLLAVISGNLQLLASPDTQAAALDRDPLDEIRKATDRAIDLTRRILAFSRRPEHGSNGGAHAPTLPRPAVVEAVSLLRATLPATITLDADVADDVSPIDLDHTSIQQVILNLGTNAAHAIGSAPGRIEVALRSIDVDASLARSVPELRVGPHVLLTVRDSGCGISPEVLPHVFEPFFTTKPPGRGTGLGLSVVHGLVYGVGGQIAIESVPGHGTTVRVYLPPSSERAHPADGPAASTPSGEPCRILYVDDEDALVWLTRRLLERRGYRVTTFTNPRQALQAFEHDPSICDVVVTDGAMPGMNGQQLTEALRAIRPDLPVLLTSGYLTQDAIDEAKRAGVSDVLLKPGRVEDLERAIHSTLAAMLERRVRA